METIDLPVRASRRVSVALVGVGAVAAGAMAWALSTGGGAARTATGFGDGGALVAWGLPATRLAADLAAVVTLGALIGALAFSPTGEDGRLSEPAGRFARLAARTGLGWALGAAGQIVFIAADLLGRPVTRLDTSALTNTALYVPQGRAQLIAMAAGLLIFGCGWLALRPGPLVVALGATVAGVVPAAYTGHAASSLDHNSATTSLAVHILFVSIWVGGLAALLLTARWQPAALPLVAGRFSTIALICFVAVAASGLFNAWLRVGSIENLAGRGYGVLLQVKLLALLVLGGIGWWHRQHTLRGIRESIGPFVRFAGVEIVIMAATVGVAVGLSRSQAPGRIRVAGLTRADALLGFPMPGEPSAAALLLDWRPDLLFTAGCVTAAAAYLAGVIRLGRRGVAWPLARTAYWLAGLAVVLVATGSGLARYAPVLFSAHMVAHMLSAMLAPILLVLGAPITLALRALPVSADKRFPGPREWLTAALHSRIALVVTHPVVAAVLWVGGLYVMYLTGAYEYALRNHPAHLAMYAHFILSGWLFFAILIGTDALPRRPGYPARVALLFVSLAFHAFFGVALMNTGTVIAADWFAELARPWGPDPLTDQRTGGGIAWAIGEVPAVIAAIVLFRQWIRDDEREQRRVDRAADRDGDAALAAYNAWLRENSGR